MEDKKSEILQACTKAGGRADKVNKAARASSSTTASAAADSFSYSSLAENAWPTRISEIDPNAATSTGHLSTMICR